MAVNATGTFLCTQAVYGEMAERRWGRIVNLASIAGMEGDKYIAAYTAAKHAVVGFSKALSKEAAGTGVTVNVVCPGHVDTPLMDEMIARIVHYTGRSWQEALDAVLASSAQPRLIRAHEVADVVQVFVGVGSGHHRNPRWRSSDATSPGSETERRTCRTISSRMRPRTRMSERRTWASSRPASAATSA